MINQSVCFRKVSVLVLAISVAACDGQNNSATDAAVSRAGQLDFGGNIRLTGSGASFPAPLYQTWFQSLNRQNKNLQISYQSTGSGAGVEQFTQGIVDFGASDVAMTDKELQKVPQDRGVLMLPMTAGKIVLGYNLPGVEQLKLSRQNYTDIFLGKIKTWNDPKIAATNPGVNLPNQPIIPVSRSDGSGTTGIFTKHLSAVSPEWKSKVGEGKTVNWPVGVGAKGNEGVTAQVLQTQGAIGYVEYGYAKQNNLKFAVLENKSGNFVEANEQSGAKTLEAVTLPANLRAFIEDPQGADSYPIVTYSWMLMNKKYSDPAKAKAIEAMIEYGLTEGQKIAPELGYVPLPQNVAQKVAAAADGISPDFQMAVGTNNDPSASK
ncbi:phosphate ABC transporter substrate-binding protein PstS [Chlorogloeopsis fritschii PCC 9212]|uniref:Phosphate-binding protein n=1 Tax=Chlorogloeopsis fritschii PCC 6912 TaxID=211165 RepID=A0A3S0ZZL2_CHLFR|nr:phosphate ABC transporter substrate-binding protein PstS [Chlorogloeopsis fritschii]RUR76177.1 phosphate-binding protein [Chlorogloeopsis fritschii PCC 6912]